GAQFNDGFAPPAPVGESGFGEEFGANDAPYLQSESSVTTLIARLQRLEEQNRRLTGQVEQLTNLLKRSQEGFERRLQALERIGGPARGDSSTGEQSVKANPAKLTHAIAGPGAPPTTLDQLAAEIANEAKAEPDLPAGVGESPPLSPEEAAVLPESA